MGLYIYICMYIYVYIYMYIYMCVCVCVCVSNKDFEERKLSIEILTKVVLESFYKPMVLGCL
jgi:cytochrome P450 family 4